MAQTEPKFKPGDRFWTHYDYKWGTVLKINHTVRDAVHGVTGSKLPDTTWYDVHYDGDPEGRTSSMLDDAHGNWDMARMVPPHIAKRFGYGDDPNPAPTEPPIEVIEERHDEVEEGRRERREFMRSRDTRWL
jgi:hypothetical protein